MNQAEFYAEWLRRLRSGEYEQGVQCLRSDSDTYCCLGVADDVAVDNSMGHWLFPASDQSGPATFVDDLMEGEAWERRESGVLTQGLAKFLGVGTTGNFDISRVGERKYDSEGNLEPGEGRGESHWLTSLNDDGLTFAQIADVIEYFFAPKGVSLDK